MKTGGAAEGEIIRGGFPMDRGGIPAAVCFLAFFFFFFFFLFPAFHGAPASARTIGGWQRTTMVEGHIEDVTFQAIRVRGNYYYFTGVPIKDAEGRNAAPHQLIKGREVKLFFRGGVINEIMVFEHPALQ
ncbi:MAG: hypothetical protein M0Z58_09765 [Nitrospiraceae bacterium]|nr:hypothetical protein [Nitrospiraceae bacterium]